MSLRNVQISTFYQPLKELSKSQWKTAEKTARLTMEITNKQVLKIFDSSYDAMKIRIRLFFFFFGVEANT